MQGNGSAATTVVRAVQIRQRNQEDGLPSLSCLAALKYYRHPDHLLDEVDAGNVLGNRVLHLLTSKSGSMSRVGIFLDFVSPPARTPRGAHAQMGGRDRIDPHRGGVEQLSSRRVPAGACSSRENTWRIRVRSITKEWRSIQFRLAPRTRNASHTHAGPQHVWALSTRGA